MKFNCLHCGQRLQCDASQVGMAVRCPNCDRKLTIPRPAETPSAGEGAAGAASPGQDSSARSPGRNKRVVRLRTGDAARPQERAGLAPASRLQRSDGTNVSTLASLGIGFGFAVAFHILLIPFSRTVAGDLFFRRGWVPPVEVLLMGWALGILALKVRKLQRQKQAMLLDVLPTDIADDITVDNVNRFIAHVKSLPAHLHESFMVKRMRHGLEHFEVRHSNPEVASMMLAQSEIDAGAIHSSYTMLKVAIWAIPILGFIGTVVGISDAVGAFSGSLEAARDLEVLKGSLNNVTTGLAVAFDTTLIALVMSVIISLPASAMQKAEEDLLGWVDGYCNENLLKRMNDAGGIPDVAVHTKAFMQSVGSAVTEIQQAILEDFQAARQRMDEVQQGQTALLQRAADAAAGQLASMEQRAAEHQKQVEANLGRMVDLVEKATGTLAGGSRAAADAVRSYCDTLTGGLASLNRVLAELGGKQVVIRKERRRWFGMLGGRADRPGETSGSAAGAAPPAPEAPALDVIPIQPEERGGKTASR